MDKKNWRNAIPVNQWMCLHDSQRNPKLIFKLRHYEIVNGAPKWEIEEHGGTIHEASVNTMHVAPALSIRLFLPIELIKLQGHSISVPKLVFTLDRNAMISPFDPATHRADSYRAARQYTPRRVDL